MAGKVTAGRVLFPAACMVVGGFASAGLALRLVDNGGWSGLLALALGAAFSGLGWFLAENVGEAVFLLLLTGALGAVAFAYLQSEILRVFVVAFLCGFNIGKFGGGIYRELGP